MLVIGVIDKQLVEKHKCGISGQVFVCGYFVMFLDRYIFLKVMSLGFCTKIYFRYSDMQIVKGSSGILVFGKGCQECEDFRHFNMNFDVPYLLQLMWE